MTRKYLFCYTRTKNIDYRNVYGVDATICPQPIQDIFLGKISALLNKTADENLKEPVYVYFRQDDIILYGIACLNSVLSADYCLEKTNGRVRGFFGIIEKTNDVVQTIPYSLDLYIKLYEKYIVPKWSSFTFHYNENIELDIPIDVSDSVIKPLAGSSLNNDLNICRVFLSPRISNNLLSEALAYKGNMSIAIGISNNEQVTEDNFPLMNATLKNDECRSYEDVAVYHICSKCGRRTKHIRYYGLCAKCYEEQITVSHKINDDSVISETPQLFCNKCGKKANELYTEKGLCTECYKEYVVSKQKSRKYFAILMGIIIVVLLMLLLNSKPLPEILNTRRIQINKGKNYQAPTSVADSLKDTLLIDTLGKQHKKARRQ